MIMVGCVEETTAMAIWVPASWRAASHRRQVRMSVAQSSSDFCVSAVVGGCRFGFGLWAERCSEDA